MRLAFALTSLCTLIVLSGAVYAFNKSKTYPLPMENDSTQRTALIHPIEHATAAIAWGDTTFYTDPLGGAAAFAGQKPAQIILLTDIHSDHLSADTLSEVSGTAVLVAPQVVKDALPEELAARVKVVKNGETISEQGFTITAIPMYNLPESADAKHVKGRGNGYVVEKDGFRIYIAGDTDGIPEMRALKNIDIALIPMNPPNTMPVEEAADATLEFKPKVVYPYHYRAGGGYSDVAKFKQLVNAGDPTIEVILGNWYPNQ